MVRYYRIRKVGKTLTIEVDLATLRKYLPRERSTELIQEMMSRFVKEVGDVAKVEAIYRVDEEESRTKLCIELQVEDRYVGHIQQVLENIVSELVTKIGYVVPVLSTLVADEDLSQYPLHHYKLVNYKPPLTTQQLSEVAKLCRELTNTLQAPVTHYRSNIVVTYCRIPPSIQRDYGLEYLYSQKPSHDIDMERALRKIVYEGIRRRLRELGYVVRGTRALHPVPIYQDEHVTVHRMYWLHTYFIEEMRPCISIVLKHRVVSNETLDTLIERGTDVHELRGQVATLGLTTGTLVTVLEVSPDREVATVRDRRGRVVEVQLKNLRKVLTTTELKKMGYSNLLKQLHVTAELYSEVLKNFASEVNPVHLGDVELNFTPVPTPLEVHPT
ncbi:MAG: hypothetical protein DRJ40_06275 [Thermoprotei archaeon]|nr:MAG: hypothetical protein DRJ40_06275 [Thermoprotei archaeon]